jgi:hypothetical protein
MKRAPIRDILWLFFLTRIALLIITYVGYILLTAPKYSSTPVDINALLSVWNHWDAANFVRIAQFGYQTRFDVAFFPLFPLLIHILAFPLSFWGGSYLLMGTLISNAALLGTMLLLYQLAVEIVGEDAARRSLLYLVIFPTAFYFFAAYNETLFLLFCLGSFLAMRRQHWWLAGLLGLLASATRSAGLLLVIPYLIEVWVTRESIAALRQNIFRRILPVVLIPIGTVAYALYCWHLSGDPIAFAAVQSHWGRHTTWPWVGIWNAIVDLFRYDGIGSFNEVHILLDLSATIGFIILTILGWRKLRLSYNIWLAILIIFMLLSPGTDKTDVLLSNQRFVLEMFPAFITLGMLGIKHPRLHQIMMMIFPLLLATLSIIFIMNKWMV